mmetsp:Transcript_7033/g.21346  ORF Transcript_7033/g.21346 Transcript_7033/m.21346 type:complete len:299 (-) Transcript_7033:264-1160(-)
MLLCAPQDAVRVPYEDVGHGCHQAQEGREGLRGGVEQEDDHDRDVDHVVGVARELEAVQGQQLLRMLRAQARPGADDTAHDLRQDNVNDGFQQERAQYCAGEQVDKQLLREGLLGRGHLSNRREGREVQVLRVIAIVGVQALTVGQQQHRPEVEHRVYNHRYAIEAHVEVVGHGRIVEAYAIGDGGDHPVHDLVPGGDHEAKERAPDATGQSRGVARALRAEQHEDRVRAIEEYAPQHNEHGHLENARQDVSTYLHPVLAVILPTHLSWATRQPRKVDLVLAAKSLTPNSAVRRPGGR